MSTQSMRPVVVCLIVRSNGVSILAFLLIAIIVVAVVVLISVAVTLISAVAIVAVVVIPKLILLIVSTLIRGTSNIIDGHILNSLHHGLHLLEHLLLGRIGGSHGVGHLVVKIQRRRRCGNYFHRYHLWFSWHSHSLL